MMRRMNIDYIAGFFDGEGCVVISKTNRRCSKTPEYQLVVDIAQKNPRVLKQIKRFLGYGQVSEYPHCCHFKVYGWKAVDLLKRLLPYLRCKQMQARYAIQFQELKEDRRPLSDKELRWREMHRRLVSIYNRRF